MANNSNNSSGSNGIGFGTVLFLVFLVLKLTGVIDWSWWWITAPIWGGLALILIVLVALFVFAHIYGAKIEK